MIRLVATSRRARAHSDEPITTGSVGIPIALTLSKDFDGLSVTLVCEAGGVSRDLAVMGGELVVPHELLTHAGDKLALGVYASLPDGTIVIPTVWAVAGEVVQGTVPSETSPSDPTPSWAAQVQQWAEDAHDTAERLAAEVDGWETEIDAAVQGAETVDATASKSGTTATITVTDREGVEHTVTVSDGAQGEAGQDGYSPSANVLQGDGSATITITDKDGTTTATVHDGTNGRDGRDGADGADGYSPTATVTQTATGATISITDKSGTTTASVSNGTDGTDGTDGIDGFSPTVDVQAITGGHEVTITDADGAHSFEVMDGDPATPGSITDEMLAPDGVKAQVAQLFGNQLTGTLSGTIATASDAYAAPLLAVGVDGKSEQDGTPTPDAPVPILSVDGLEVHASADGGTTDYTNWPVSDLLPVGTNLRSLSDAKDALNLSYLRPSTHEGWAWYSRELVQRVMHSELTGDITGEWYYGETPNSRGIYTSSVTLSTAQFDAFFPNRTVQNNYVVIGATSIGVSNRGAASSATIAGLAANPSTRRVYIRTDTQYDASSIAAMFAHGPVGIDYIAAEPVTTQLDPIELPQLPAPNCTVWCDGGSAQPSFVMQYVQDTNIVIAELRAALADLATS